MNRPPFKRNESVFSRGIGVQILWVGLLMGLVSLLPGYLMWRSDAAGTWQTVIFTTLTLSQMGNALAIRSSQDSILTIGFWSNRSMVVAIALTFLLQIALIYVPFAQNIFGTEALGAGELALSLALSVIVFAAVEIEKWVKRARAAA